jgi:hypothetical protein
VGHIPNEANAKNCLKIQSFRQSNTVITPFTLSFIKDMVRIMFGTVYNPIQTFSVAVFPILEGKTHPQ